MGVKVIDHGFDKYKKAVQELNSKKIHVGLFAAVGDKVLTKAIVNEFGTKNAGKNKNITIPERSFVRSTFNKQYKKVASRFNQIFISFGKRQYDISRRFKLIGVEQEMETKKTINDMKTPPNAPSTIRAKGSSKLLIDTGEMRSKISSEVQNK